MQNTFTQIVKSALEIGCDEFCQTVEETAGMLREEHGTVGNLSITGRLIKAKPQGEALVMSDIHGDLESLIDIFKNSNFLQRMSRNSSFLLIFLGDYGDRGAYPVEVYYSVLKLKLLYPRQVVLMRGNHEGPEDLLASPHDLPMQFHARFGEKGTEAYSKVRELHEVLYNAVIVGERYLMIHGGLPAKTDKIDDLAHAHEKHPKESLLEEMLWSDPDEMINDVCASPRGAGKLFGIKITERVLGQLNVKMLVRGHEPCEEGYKINHRGKVLTIFSRKGPPYFNTHGAYLDFDLSREFEKAEQLVPFIHVF